MLSLGSDSARQSSLSRFSRVNQALPTHAIHRSQRSTVVIQQPHAAGVALALFDERLGEDAEEAGDVGLAHEQIERGLDGVALDVGHALGAAAIVGLARQGLFQRVDLGLGRELRRERVPGPNGVSGVSDASDAAGWRARMPPRRCRCRRGRFR